MIEWDPQFVDLAKQSICTPIFLIDKLPSRSSVNVEWPKLPLFHNISRRRVRDWCKGFVLKKRCAGIMQELAQKLSSTIFSFWAVGESLI